MKEVPGGSVCLASVVEGHCKARRCRERGRNNWPKAGGYCGWTAVMRGLLEASRERRILVRLSVTWERKVPVGPDLEKLYNFSSWYGFFFFAGQKLVKHLRRCTGLTA